MLTAAFLANPSLAQLWHISQAMSQVLTQDDCVDQIWDQYSSQVWKSICILGDIVALEQWSNHEFQCTRNKRETLQECSAPWMRRGTSCRSSPCLRSLKKGFWDNWSSRQWIVENARDRSSRLLRFCFVLGQTGDEHARYLIQHKMKRASRAIQGIRKEKRSTTNSICIPHVSGFPKQTRLRKIHQGEDEQQFASETCSPRVTIMVVLMHEIPISSKNRTDVTRCFARRGRKCRPLREGQARLLHVHWSWFRRELAFWNVSRKPKRKSDELVKQVMDVSRAD